MLNPEQRKAPHPARLHRSRSHDRALPLSINRPAPQAGYMHLNDWLHAKQELKREDKSEPPRAGISAQSPD